MLPFVIWFQHRSGSSHLVSLLNSHPEIECKGEIFGGQPAADDLSGIDARYLNKQCYRRVLNRFPGKHWDPTDQESLDELRTVLTGKPISGFKFKFPSQAGLYPEITTALLDSCDKLRLIVLHRRDFLRRALSVLNLERVQTVTKRANVNRKIDLPPLQVDPNEVIRLVQYYQSIDAEFSCWSNSFHQKLELDYQDLLQRPDHIGGQLQMFLKVNESMNLHSRTKKITPSRLVDSVANFEELQRALDEAGIECSSSSAEG